MTFGIFQLSQLDCRRRWVLWQFVLADFYSSVITQKIPNHVTISFYKIETYDVYKLVESREET